MSTKSRRGQNVQKGARQNSKTSREFDVPEGLRNRGIDRIAKIGPLLVVEYKGKTIAVSFNLKHFDKAMEKFRRKAIATIDSDDAAVIIQQLEYQISKSLVEYIESQSQNGPASSSDLGDRLSPPVPAKVAMSKWQAELRQKYDNLRRITEKNLPGLWLPLMFALSVKCILNIANISLPFAGIILGPPSSSKSLAVDMPKGARNTFYTDSFTAKSIVSHSTSVPEEELANIDLLPKMKNNCFLVPELSPMFTVKDDDLSNTFGVITRVLDGKGYVSDTGARGHRGYDEPTMFVWVGAAVDIPYKVHKLLGTLGPKLYFFRLPAMDLSEDEYFEYLQSDDFNERAAAVKKALFDYLGWLESCPIMQFDEESGIPKISWNKSKDDPEVHRSIIRLAQLLSHLRGIVSTRETEGTQGLEYAYTSASIEDPRRAMTQLRNLARGHALSQGRNFVSMEDIPVIVKVVLSSAASIERVKALDILINKGSAGTHPADLAAEMNTSIHTAERTIAEFKALGLVDVGSREYGSLEVKLKQRFSWFFSDDFKRLREGYEPGDYLAFLKKDSKKSVHKGDDQAPAYGAPAHAKVSASNKNRRTKGNKQARSTPESNLIDPSAEEKIPPTAIVDADKRDQAASA